MPYIGNVLTSFAVETGNINDQAITSPKLSATGGTDGQVLALDSNGDLVWSSDPAGQWVTSGDDIFYTTGNVGIGVSSPGQALDVADVDIAPLRVTRDQAVSSGAGLVLRQPNTTDGNDLRIVYQTDTTGTGASSDVFFAALEFTAATHDHDTRAGEIGFFTAQGGTGFVDRMRIRSDGTVRIGGSTLAGIGTKVQVHDGADNRNILGVTGADVSSEYIALGIISGDPTITAGNAGSDDTALRFDVASSGTESEAMRIDSDGRLLIGTDTALTTPAGSRLTVVGDDFSTSSITGIRYQTNSNGASLLLMAANGTEASPTSVSGDDELGKVRFYGHDGTDFASFGASIECRVDNTPSENVVPGRLQFWTTDAVGGINERMRISHDGEVRIIGTMEADANNAYNLVIRGDDSGTDGESAQIFLGAINASTRGAVIAAERISSGNDHDLLFKVSSSGALPTERMRLRRDGRLLIGTDATLGTDRLLQVADTSAEAGAELIRYVDAASSAPVLSLAKSRGTSVGSDVTVGENDVCGYIQFKGNNGTSFLNAAWITGEIDGEPNTGGDTTDMPGRLVFSTTPNGSSSASERMRITNTGNIRLPSGSPGIQFDGNTAADDSLSDYEEGTWTPSLTFGGDNAGMSISTRDGHYVKIGKVVHCIFIFVLSNKGTSTGQALLTGLPHNVADELTSTSLEGGGIMTYAENIAGTVRPPYTIACQHSSTTASLFTSPDSNEQATNLTNGNFANNTSLRGVFTYLAG